MMASETQISDQASILKNKNKNKNNKNKIEYGTNKKIKWH